ncbi:MAG: hypothetical protein DCC68_08845, partial [Planctomycetota bacterium]
MRGVGAFGRLRSDAIDREAATICQHRQKRLGLPGRRASSRFQFVRRPNLWSHGNGNQEAGRQEDGHQDDSFAQEVDRQEEDDGQEVAEGQDLEGEEVVAPCRGEPGSLANATAAIWLVVLVVDDGRTKRGPNRSNNEKGRLAAARRRPTG